LGLKRHFLHATRLTFKRPSDMEEITIGAELLPDLQASLDLLNEDQ
jgi:hypothetical protein